jgi:hypothetical protein
MRLLYDGSPSMALEMTMFDNRTVAFDQVERLTQRINEVATDYSRAQIKRSVCLRSGDVRQARVVARRMHLLTAELAYLAGMLKQSDEARPLLAQMD